MKRVFFQKLLAGVVLFGLSWAPSVQAEEVEGGGSASYVTVSVEEFELAEGQPAIRVHQKGTLIAEGTPFHLGSQDCFSTVVLASEGPSIPLYGYCDSTDRDGDMWVVWIKDEQGGGSIWGFLGGTGKYVGIEGGGTSKVEMQSEDRMVVTWEGKWTLK